MPQYEGFVLKTGGRNEAEVMIHPERAGIIGASNLTVCHAASESSNICARAENSIGAETGDRVRIRRDGSALFKNVSTLIGVPLLGLTAGLLVSALLRDSLGGQVVVTCAGTSIGSINGGVFLPEERCGAQPCDHPGHPERKLHAITFGGGPFLF